MPAPTQAVLLLVSTADLSIALPPRSTPRWRGASYGQTSSRRSVVRLRRGGAAGLALPAGTACGPPAAAVHVAAPTPTAPPATSSPTPAAIPAPTPASPIATPTPSTT